MALSHHEFEIGKPRLLFQFLMRTFLFIVHEPFEKYERCTPDKGVSMRLTPPSIHGNGFERDQFNSDVDFLFIVVLTRYA